MSNQRIPLDLSGFTEPKPKDKPTKQQIDEVASESGFTTRHAPRQAEEPQPERNRPVAPTKPAAHPADEAVQQEPMRRGRKRTTNRNTPFAVKLKLETNNAIYRLAEELECNAIAEVIERAIAALEREIADRR